MLETKQTQKYSRIITVPIEIIIIKNNQGITVYQWFGHKLNSPPQHIH